MKKLKFLLPILLVVLVVCINICKVYAADLSYQYPEGEDYNAYYSLDSTKTESFSYTSIYNYMVEQGITTNNGGTYTVTVPEICNYDAFAQFISANGTDVLSNLPHLTTGWSYGDQQYHDLSDYLDTVLFLGDRNNANNWMIFRTTATESAIICDSSHLGNWYYVSSEPFSYYISNVFWDLSNNRWQENVLWQGYATLPRITEVSTSNSSFNNLYTVQMPNNFLNYNSAPLLTWAACPIYVANSELHPFDYTTFDFANASQYDNINLNMINGSFPSGDSGEGEIVANSKSDKYNLSFRMSNVYAGTLTHIWHYIGNLHFNSYIEAHPERFWLCANYTVQYQDDHMATPKTFYYGGTDLVDALTISDNIGLMAYRISGDVNGDLPNNWAYGLQLSDFRDENDVSLVTYIATTMNRVTGTNTTYIDLDELLVADPVSYINSLITGKQPVLTSVSPIYGSSILKFQLRSEVFVSTQDPRNTSGNDDGYDSNPNISTYNFLSGDVGVISSDNTYEPNKPPASGEEDGEQIVTGNPPAISNGGGNTTYGGPVAKIESGAIVINNGGKDLVVDVGALENFKGIIETLKTELLDKKDDSFIAIIKENYELFPVPILTIFIIGACVTVFAGFVKVVTRR